MNRHHKSTFREQLPVFLVQLVLCATMVGVYALLRRLTEAVVWGALAGTAAALLNYAWMIVSLLRAERSDSPQKGQLKAQGNYILRMLVLIAALVVAIKYGNFDPIATLLPLILMRGALFIGGLMIKKESKGELPK